MRARRGPAPTRSATSRSTTTPACGSSPTAISLDVVIDEAEIPTFSERQRLDTDGDGSVSDDEIEAERLVACQRLAGSLHLTVDGAAETLAAFAAGLSMPPGAAACRRCGPSASTRRRCRPRPRA